MTGAVACKVLSELPIRLEGLAFPNCSPDMCCSGEGVVLEVFWFKKYILEIIFRVYKIIEKPKQNKKI